MRRYVLLTFPYLFYDGITLFPFIIIRHKRLLADKVFINHERIHLRQQLEMLVIPFYIIYLINYLVNLLIYRSHLLAYMNIVFEREAFYNEKNLRYLLHRKLFGFVKYLRPVN